MPKIIIDNRHIEVPAGTKVIEAAEQLGIVIPRFCYHPALGSVGACRVCAVTFTDGPVRGVQMSCMVNAQDGMAVSTTDDEAVDFRRHVIEWLMLNHPHDCPVCDEGGHCLLQDLTIAGGHGLRRYQGLKRTHTDQYLGPFVQHEMNRCIQCYRCARYYQEFAGSKDLGVLGIGARVYFGRSQPGTLDSAFSGNLIDICPTGVYTDKPSRFFGRRWDFERAPAICLHCSLGCNLVVSARYRQVVRHEAAMNRNVNGHFICDRGRFGYCYASADYRPRQAMINGSDHPLPDALSKAQEVLADVVLAYGPSAVALVGSVRSNLETLAVISHLCSRRKWQGPIIESETRITENLAAATSCLDSDLAVSLAAVSVADTVLVMGADPANEAPMLSLSLRQVQHSGGHVALIDPRAIALPLEFDHFTAVPAAWGPWINQLVALCAAGRPSASPDQSTPADGSSIDPRLQTLAEKICQSKRVVIVCGTDITTADEIDLAAGLVRDLRKSGIEAKLFYPLSGPNAFAAGLLMHDEGSVEQILARIEGGAIQALLVVENDLWRLFPDRGRLVAALDRLEHLILLDHLASPLCERASVFVPTQTIYESGGHWVNQEGRLQKAEPVMAAGEPLEITGGRDHPPRVFEDQVPGGQPMVAWEALLKLAPPGDFKLTNEFDDQLAEALQRIYPKLGVTDRPEAGRRIELHAAQSMAAVSAGDEPDAQTTDGQQIIEVLLVDQTFGTEVLSAHTEAVMERASTPEAVMHPQQAEILGLKAGQEIKIETEAGSLAVRLAVEARMATGLMVIPRHVDLEWQTLGATRFKIRGRQIKLISKT